MQQRLLKEENIGPSKIISLEIDCREKAKEEKDEINSIVIIFNDIESINNSESYPIRYIITGRSRDWVMVTTSLIEDRIQKIKRSIWGVSSESFISFFFFVFILTIIVFFSIHDLSPVGSGTKKAIEEVKRLNTDSLGIGVIDAILILEEGKLNETSNVALLLNYMFPIMGAIIVTIMLSKLKWSKLKLYPLYNFCWGDYLMVFERYERRRKFIFYAIIFTIFLGITINLISSYIWRSIN